jgi:hypothetical protein
MKHFYNFFLLTAISGFHSVNDCHVDCHVLYDSDVTRLIAYSPGCNFPVIDVITAIISKTSKRRGTLADCILPLNCRNLASFVEMVAFRFSTFSHAFCRFFSFFFFSRRNASRFCRVRHDVLFVCLQSDSPRDNGLYPTRRKRTFYKQPSFYATTFPLARP